MVIALPVFGSQISPRFDCAETFLLAIVKRQMIEQVSYLPMKEKNLLQRIKKLSSWKVDKIICDGIDDFSLRLLSDLEIQVIPWITGNAQQALEEFLSRVEVIKECKEKEEI